MNDESDLYSRILFRQHLLHLHINRFLKTKQRHKIYVFNLLILKHCLEIVHPNITSYLFVSSFFSFKKKLQTRNRNDYKRASSSHFISKN